MPADSHDRRVPLLAMLVLVVTLAVAEGAIMVLLEQFALSPRLTRVLDALLLLLVAAPLGYVVVYRPLARRARALEEAGTELRSATEAFESIVTQSTDGVLIVDEAGIVRYANPAAQRMLGQEAALVGRPLPKQAEIGRVTELGYFRADGSNGVAEMRVFQTTWRGQPALHVSLRDITESARLRQDLVQLSVTDPLTELNNVRGLQLLAEQQFKLAARAGQGLALLFIDLDRMKWINDHFGHAAGDRALITFAQILRDTFRESDVIARTGGDEFVVLSLVEAGAGSNALIHRLSRALQDRRPDGPPLSFSVGVSRQAPGEQRSLEEMLKEADDRMYDHKRSATGISDIDA